MILVKVLRPEKEEIFNNKRLKTLFMMKTQ